MNEAKILINGNELTFAQSMTIRVSLESFAMVLHNAIESGEGDVIEQAYLNRIKEIREQLYNG